MRYKYPLAKPNLGLTEIHNLSQCIHEGWVSSGGSFVDEFEEKMACECSREHGVATTSGTTALHLALAALGIGPGKKVLVPTLTYIAPVNAILYCGATPVFCDSRKSDWQMDEESIPEILEYHCGDVKAILAVHLYGVPCDIVAIEKICKEKNILLIEDCAEALGASVDGRPVGNFGDASCFSFYGNKTITTGEGGMIVCDKEGVQKRLKHLRSHATLSGEAYRHDELGYNYRLSNLQAAVGVAQMDRLEDILAQKKRIFDLYTKTIFLKFNEIGSTLRNELKTWRLRGRELEPGFWLYSLITESEELRTGLMRYLREKGIETRPFFTPAHTMEYIDRAGIVNHFPVAEELSRKGFNLPSYPALTNEDVKFISGSVLKYLLKNVTR